MVNFSRNEANMFQYASTLQIATASPIVLAYGTTAAGKIKRVHITDIAYSCGSTARSFRLSGQGGAEKDLQLSLPASVVGHIPFVAPYALSAVSSTGATRAIYASASGAGVQVVISGYIDHFD